jgi:hypothetical protein
MMVRPEATIPENSSTDPIVVSNFKDLTGGFLDAAFASGVKNRVEITTSEIKRFTLIPASDRARLS